MTLIIKKNIKLQQQARDWQDAIKQSGQLLLNNGSIDPVYIEEMIQAVIQLGPYIVIVPHIALGHARPSRHVLKNDMSLLTLQTPIRFGNEANDPVSIVFAFCALENSGHLQFLQRLGLLFDDAPALRTLRNSNDLDEVLNIINR